MYYKKLNKKLNTLTKKNLQDAGLDLASAEDTIIPAGRSKLVDTGIQIAIPKDHVGLVWARSGLAVKHSITVGAGVIDNTYRGNVKVLLFNFGTEAFQIKRGDRIAQILTMPINVNLYTEVKHLDDTERGSGGFGSTGV